MPTKPTYELLSNSRFYILASTFLISILVCCWLRLQLPSDQLLYIRSQQVFGLLCLIYWYLALIISPIGHIVGKQRMKHVEFARRAIGVSAFYFALLHAGIALWGQLGGFGQLVHLPALFQWSLLGGAIALCVLAVMAATSFDRVVQFMTYRKWKLLHRLVYAAFILVVLHIWSIGTHLAYSGIQLAAFAMLVVLLGLELYGIMKVLNKKYLHFDAPEFFTSFFAAWVLAAVLVFMIPSLVRNYHGNHTSHSDHDETEHSEDRQ